MTKIIIINPDGCSATVEIEMDEFWTLAQTFISETKIEVPPMYFNKTGATIIIK